MRSSVISVVELIAKESHLNLQLRKDRAPEYRSCHLKYEVEDQRRHLCAYVYEMWIIFK